MYAVIEASGGQLRVTGDEELLIDLVDSGNGKAGDKINFDKVLLIAGDGEAKIGQPYVAGASVSAEIVEPMIKGEKIDIIKYRPKKMYRRKTGHRQRYTKVKITGITG